MLRICFALLLCLPLTARAAPLTVFAAASLTEALGRVAALWAEAGHGRPVLSFAASSTLAQGILHGAPANVFISADETWMDTLAKDGAIVAATRRDIVGNVLVLVEPKRTLRPVHIRPGLDWTAILGADGRLAVGDPAHVPAGIYAKQALQKLGLWEEVAGRLAPADSVRSALLLVERGEAPAGIVYATDVAVSATLGVAGTFPGYSHDPIRYPAAVVARNDAAEAREFVAFLASPAAQEVFAGYGFMRP